MLGLPHIETLAESLAIALEGDQEWLRRVFIVGTLDEDHHDFIAQLALRVQGKLKRDIGFYGSDTPMPSNKIVLVDDFDTILDLQLIQALSCLGNLVVCKYKAGSIVSILHGVSHPETVRSPNQRSLLSYIRFMTTFRRSSDEASVDVHYSTYLRFSQFIQDQLAAATRHRWQDVLKPHLSLEAHAPVGTLVISRGMKFGNTALERAVANDIFWDA